MLTHLGKLAICKLLEIYKHSWSSGTLLQIWWEAIMMHISKSDFDKRHTWKPYIAQEKGIEARQNLTIMRKLGGTICGD